MRKEEIIRAWKDEAYRSTLSNEEIAALPPNPAGVIDLSDAQLGGVAGAGSIGWSILISLETVTFAISCHACEETIFAGGSCQMGTAGCCGEESTGGGGETAL
jgi:mersacidin/lichenicidin family type 2 lantibiotic